MLMHSKIQHLKIEQWVNNLMIHVQLLNMFNVMVIIVIIL